MILDGRDASAIAQAAQRLAAGDLVGFPTETVYGLGADADNDAAVAGIFAAKGRPSDHPLIVHVADASGVAHFAASVPPFAQALMQAFWPGPLTLVVPRTHDCPVARIATAGLDTMRATAMPLLRRRSPIVGSSRSPRGARGRATFRCRRRRRRARRGCPASPPSRSTACGRRSRWCCQCR